METTATAAKQTLAPKSSSGSSGRPSRGDARFRAITAGFGVLLVVLLGVIVLALISQSKDGLARFGLRFVWSTDWDPVRESFGAAPFVFGTIVSSLVSLCLAVPVSLGIAIYLTELAPPWLRRPASFVVELLAAVPSVIYGLWGIFVLTPWLRESVEPKLESAFGFLPLFQGPHIGFGMLAGGIVLSIMILPTISSVMREVLATVPPLLRENALALGATRYEAIRLVILPFVRSGLVGATILGLGRALGETMAVLMILSPGLNYSVKLLQASQNQTIAANIAAQYPEANDLGVSVLIGTGLVLFLITFVVNFIARKLTEKASV